MPTGRPSEYDKKMCTKLVRLMRGGASITTVAAKLGISRETLYDWSNEDSDRFKQDFSDALKKGLLLAESFWEELGKKAAKGDTNNFSAAAWIFTMKNKFKWSDKKEIEMSGQLDINKISDEDLDERIKELESKNLA